MRLRLTADILEGAYIYLARTDPFRSWKMPHEDVVGFHVIFKSDFSGSYQFINGVHTIKIHARRNNTTDVLHATMAHEMIHLRQELLGHRDHHGPRFHRMARRVCGVHGFSLEDF